MEANNGSEEDTPQELGDPPNANRIAPERRLAPNASG
jgi:hypothetical protein